MDGRLNLLGGKGEAQVGASVGEAAADLIAQPSGDGGRRRR